MRQKNQIVLSILLGVLIGLFSTLFYLGVHYIDKLIRTIVMYSYLPIFTQVIIGVIFVGIAWWLVYHYAPEAAGSGIQEMKASLIHKGSDRWWRVIPIKLIGGVLALCSHLLLGREGPTIQLGGNLGMMISDRFKLDHIQRDTYIAAGAAAGLTAAFNAPLAGVLFIFEEMRPHFSFSVKHVQIVGITCFVSSLVIHFLMGNAPVIANASHILAPEISLIWYGFLGIVVALMGWLFNVLLIRALDQLDKLSMRGRIIFLVLVSVVVSCLAMQAPYYIGEGYHLIQLGLHVSLSMQVLMILIIVRLVLGLASYGIGTPGGIFSPLLALGTLVGLWFAHLLQYFLQITPNEVQVFAIAGMGGLFAAVVRSPLTAVVLLMEMTHNQKMFFPLFVTCFVSSTFVDWIGNLPIYDQLIKRNKT